VSESIIRDVAVASQFWSLDTARRILVVAWCDLSTITWSTLVEISLIITTNLPFDF
jgi:hypothetical protein